MFCNECGKLNPEGAKFCAYCGAKLLVSPAAEPVRSAPAAEEAEAHPAGEIPAANAEEPVAAPASAGETPAPEKPVPAPEEPAPAAEPPLRVPPVAAYAPRTAFSGSIVAPMADNPAQPARPGDAPRPAPEPVEPELVPASPTPQAEAESVAAPFAEAKDRSPAKGAPFSVRFFTPKPDDAPATAPDELEDWPDEAEPAARKPLFGRAAADTDGEKPRRFRLPGLSPAERRRNNLVLTSSGTEELPARKPPVSREKRETFIPERVVPDKGRNAPVRDDTGDEDEEDIFFMKPKAKKAPARRSRRDEEEEREAQDEAYVNGRVRLILASIAFVVCLAAAFWLFATQSGRVFRAGFGLSDDPAAYRVLGDSALANNQVKRAADAYYQALALDPDDYATALLVGVTQQQIGNYDQADRAYQKCIELRPNDPEPYVHIVQLNLVRGDTARADYFRQLGLQQTGLSDLGV